MSNSFHRVPVAPPSVADSANRAIAGASAGAVVGALGGGVGAAVGAVIGAAANVAVGYASHGVVVRGGGEASQKRG